MPRLTTLLLLAALTALTGADDPYAAWGHGRPQDALPALHQTATTTQRWDAWLDLGLAAAAADQRGKAVAWLVRAHQAAPEQAGPREALAALGATLPGRWLDRLGPLALPGIGWPGLALLALAGFAAGHALAGRRRRGLALGVLTAALVLALPGQLAWQHDHRQILVATVRDSHLVDSAGAPQDAVPMGTIAIRAAPDAWSGRVLVALPDGRRGYLAEADLVAQP
jgi:hypothetical protein